MAESIGSLLVQQLGNLLVQGNKLFGELSSDLQFIKGEFDRIIAFLRVADIDAVEDKDPEVAVWVKQVREIAYDTEDVLDEHDLLLSSHRGRVQRIFAFIKNLRARPRLATEIKSIKSRVRDISEGRQRYCARYEIHDQVWRSGVGNYSEVGGRGAALLQDEADLVGIKRQKGELLTLLLDGYPKLKVVSVVGMGGLGKTTLVRKVYNDADVKSQFECHAWVNVSTSYDIKELLKNIIKQFCGEIKVLIPQEVQSMDDNELKEFIKGFVQQIKYIIVFDDVWDINLWDAIKYALYNGSSHSRVMLTTRIRDVASASCTDLGCYVYEMKFLSPDDSWILFCRKVFKDNNCPSHLKDISERILSKCGDLPLAIVAIGGILALKDKGRLEDWDLIYRGIGVELEGEGKLDRVKRILLLSFFNLPHHLKACLLYLSIFPEDYKMDWIQVIRLWIAEGFVEEKEGWTREEVGQSYLNELVNRSLLQVVDTAVDGRMEACNVHDILLEIIVSKSRKENLVTVAGEKAIRWPNKVRRLAIHGPVENAEGGGKFEHLRSLVLFSPKDLPPKPCLSKMLCGGSRVLKVLDLRGAPLKMIPEEVFKLYLLRYLSLRSTNVKTVPKSIGKLSNLETLDLKDTFVTELPAEILKLRRLRHLIVYRYEDLRVEDGILSFRAPYKIGNLVSLQKLSYMEADKEIVREIGRLTELRRLGITKVRREDGKDLCSSLERLTNLRSLFVVSVEEDEIIDLQTLCSAPRLLRTLSLRGRLEKLPQWIPSLEGLTKIGLLGSRLKDEPLRYLEDLPNLVELYLFRFYEGEEMHFKAGKFQRIKKLVLASLNGLRWVRVEKSSMPCLEELVIIDSKLMEELPSGIEHLSNLQYVEFVDMAEKLVTSLQNEESRRTQAKIYVGNWKKEHMKKLQHVEIVDRPKQSDISSHNEESGINRAKISMLES